MNQITPYRKTDKVDKLKKAIQETKEQGVLVLPKPPPSLEQKQMAKLEEELLHAYLAAYITYPREVFLRILFMKRLIKYKDTLSNYQLKL